MPPARLRAGQAWSGALAEILSRREVDKDAAHALLRMARLTLAMEAAAEAVGHGEVKATGR